MRRNHGDPRTRKVGLIAAYLTLIVAGSGDLFGKSLHWPSMTVNARLEANGALRVHEVLEYEFDGDWNGGERSFDLRQGQSITVHEMTRIDPDTGQRTVMTQGDLDEVDHWSETSAGVLRWRARLPSDPPFSNQRITYEIDYSYFGAIVRDGDKLRIAHDFAFAKRDGGIDRFTLTLEFDPAWQVPILSPLKKEAQQLPPGEGYVVPIELTYKGDTSAVFAVSPEQLATTASGEKAVIPATRQERRMIAGALMILAMVSLAGFLALEMALGRFNRVDPAPVDPGWLQREIFAHPPEVIGAAWDESVNDAEVASVFMRLQRERKIHATFGEGVGGRPRFEMRLLQPLESFSGYEKALLDGYFVSGTTITSDELRSHYKATGFQPVQLIKDGIMERVSTMFGEAPAKAPSRWWLWVPLFFAGPALAAAGLWSADRTFPGFITSFLSLLFGSIITAGFGAWFRSRVDRGFIFLTLVGIPAWAAIAGTYALIARAPLPAMTLAGAAVTGYFIFISFLGGARTGRGRESMAGRKRLVRARKFFASELKKENPALMDDWYPWIVAFGLEDKVTKWASSFAGASTSQRSHRTSTWHSDSSSSSSSSTGSSSSWTGGGGSFGGAGATGAWTAAAASIAAPSSSSSSGGGSSSSSSSGGGGGGGW